MVIPNQIELLLLMSLIFVCMFMFFINRETNMTNQAMTKLVSHQTDMDEKMTAMETLFKASMEKVQESSLVVSRRLDSHDVFFDDFLEADSNPEERPMNVEFSHEDRTSMDEEDSEDDLDSENDQDGEQMRMLIAHIDAIRSMASSSVNPTSLVSIMEETSVTSEIKPISSSNSGCTIDLMDDVALDNIQTVLDVAIPSIDTDMIRVKALLKASHVDCRGSNETLMRKLAALQSSK